jgi:hypothetical protein
MKQKACFETALHDNANAGRMKNNLYRALDVQPDAMQSTHLVPKYRNSYSSNLIFEAQW